MSATLTVWLICSSATPLDAEVRHDNSIERTSGQGHQPAARETSCVELGAGVIEIRPKPDGPGSTYQPTQAGRALSDALRSEAIEVKGSNALARALPPGTAASNRSPPGHRNARDRPA